MSLIDKVNVERAEREIPIKGVVGSPYVKIIFSYKGTHVPFTKVFSAGRVLFYPYAKDKYLYSPKHQLLKIFSPNRGDTYLETYKYHLPYGGGWWAGIKCKDLDFKGCLLQLKESEK